MKFKLQMLLGMIEATYGTDPVPSPATNWLGVENIQVNPVEMDTDDQATVSDKFGQDEKIVGAIRSTISFDVPLRGSGTAGTAPNLDVVLRAAGMAKVTTAGASVVYSPVDSGDESATFYWYMDRVLQKMTGVRGSWSIKFDAKKKALLSFKGIGLRSAMSDSAGGIPAATLPTLPRPVAVNKANTTLAFGAYAAFMSTLTVDSGSDVQYRNLTNREDVTIVDRNSTLSASIELPPVATKNLLGTNGLISDALTDSLTVVHGTTAGNIVTLTIPKAQFFSPKLSNEQGQAMLQCDGMVVRNALTLSFT